MLVFSRQLDESIKIGDQVQIRVVRVTASRVLLGIEAPRRVRVVRDEVRRPSATEIQDAPNRPRDDR